MTSSLEPEPQCPTSRAETSLSLTVNEGASWTQTATNWTQINGGTMTLEDATFTRSAGGNFVLSFASDDSGVLSATNSTINLGGELWFGHNFNTGNQNAQVTLANSTINASGSVGVWFWDSDAAGNSMSLNILGAGSTINGRVGRRNSEGSNNSVTWEILWDEGLLQFNGSNNGDFGNHFTTSGTPGTTTYSLTSIQQTPSTPSINGIDYAPESDTVKLTWRKSGASSYIAKYATTMTDWTNDMGGNLTEALDENPSDPDHITVTFPLTDFGIENFDTLFFRIEEE